MQVRPIKTRLFREGESLSAFILEHLPSLKEGSVLIVTSKIAALAEKRTAPLGDEKSREKIIRAESSLAIKTPWVWLTLKDGMVMANAGIDESNADGKLILLPKDSYRAAAALRTKLMQAYGIANLGVVVTDSRVLPLRTGIVGIALGYAGIKGLKDYRKEKDLYGRGFKFEQVSIADGLAAAGVLVMGEGDECQPLAVIEGAPVEFTDRVKKHELQVAFEDDIYLPFFGKLKLPKNRS